MPDNNAQSNNGRRGNRPYNKRRGGNFNRSKNTQNTQGKNRQNRRPKSLSPSRVLQKYDNLLDQHLIARKKYFELSGKTPDKQLEKAKSNFFSTLVELKKFQDALIDWQKETLDQKLNFYPPDDFISKNYPEEKIEVDFNGEFEDPHFLESQRDVDFSQDQEVTIGTMDDYFNYKGITPKEPEEIDTPN